MNEYGEPTHFAKLPNEMKNMIFKLLDHTSILSLRTTSKFFYEFIEDMIRLKVSLKHPIRESVIIDEERRNFIQRGFHHIDLLDFDEETHGVDLKPFKDLISLHVINLPAYSIDPLCIPQYRDYQVDSSRFRILSSSKLSRLDLLRTTRREGIYVVNPELNCIGTLLYREHAVYNISLEEDKNLPNAIVNRGQIIEIQRQAVDLNSSCVFLQRPDDSIDTSRNYCHIRCKSLLSAIRSVPLTFSVMCGRNVG
ncbi:unnamed protein product [Bemisia tabaci]|uniref:F-box domain-containing protein n=1 Tax=Bemisia tabaci TaxID=7038 RepID=A0A9P0ALK4_BEMTA|nr:unnamed protein product [Bemisia tabaci]